MPLPIKFSFIILTIYVTHFILEELMKADYHYHILILFIGKLRQCDLCTTTDWSPCQTTQVSSMLGGFPYGAKSTSAAYKWRNTLVSPVFLLEISKRNSWEHRAVKCLSLCFLFMFWLNLPLLPQHPWQERRLLSKGSEVFWVWKGCTSLPVTSRGFLSWGWANSSKDVCEMSYPCGHGRAAAPDLCDCHQHLGRSKEDAKVNGKIQATKMMSARLSVPCWAPNLQCQKLFSSLFSRGKLYLE